MAGANVSSTYTADVVEQLDKFPASSIALAKNWLLVLSTTVTGTAKAPFTSETAVPRMLPVQAEFPKMCTVVCASVVPVTVGALLFDGPTGAVPETVGILGGVESSTYVGDTLEHEDTFPAASFARA